MDINGTDRSKLTVRTNLQMEYINSPKQRDKRMKLYRSEAN